MRSAILVSICMLLGTAVAAPLPVQEIGTCMVIELPACFGIVIGDVIVHEGETAPYNNGTYTFHGNVTVESGGLVEMILSEITFADESPVHVQAGGTIVIDSSRLRGSATEGAHTPILQLDAGAIVTIVSSDFTALTVAIASDNATMRDNSFQLGFPALLLTDFDGELSETSFQNNIEAINATGGAPTIHDVRFLGDALAISLDRVDCVIRDIVQMEDVQDGIRITNGACLMTSIALNDRSLPPDIGIEIINGVGQSTISFNSIDDFGTGVYYCNATVVMHDNTFSGNGQDVVGC